MKALPLSSLHWISSPTEALGNRGLTPWLSSGTSVSCLGREIFSRDTGSCDARHGKSEIRPAGVTGSVKRVTGKLTLLTVIVTKIKFDIFLFDGFLEFDDENRYPRTESYR